MMDLDVWAISEYLMEVIGCYTLFSTHGYELTALKVDFNVYSHPSSLFAYNLESSYCRARHMLLQHMLLHF